jgi:hypothetical protein
MDITNGQHPNATTLLRGPDQPMPEDPTQTGFFNPGSPEAIPERAHPSHSEEPTLLSLIEAIHEVTDDHQEVIATVAHLLSSGRVRFRGHFQDEGVPVTVKRH